MPEPFLQPLILETDNIPLKAEDVSVIRLRDSAGDEVCVPTELENVIIIFLSCGYRIVTDGEQ